MNTLRRTARSITLVVGAIAVVSLMAAACSDDDTTAGGDDTTSTTERMDDEMGGDMDGDMGGGMDGDMAALDPSGPACAAVPMDGAGSFDGMAQDPAATAASNNPELSTLVAAVGAADLVDTLNGDGPFTIFAPANAAFEAIPADTLDAVLADQAQLTEILTYHVVAGERLSSEALVAAGSATTVQGGELSFSSVDGALQVDGAATGVCVDVPTANATVHIIDAVLMPAE